MADVIGSKVKYNLNNHYREEDYLRENIKALREALSKAEATLEGKNESVHTLILAQDRLTKEELIAALGALFPK